MAKKRLRIKDRSGNVVDYDVAASSVTLNDGVDVEQKIADIDEEVADLSETRYRKPVNGVPRTDLDDDVNSSLDKADSAIQGLIVNNEEVVPDSTTKKVRINIPTQVQSDWNESSQSSPAFIKNKPTVVSNVFYESSTGKIWVSTGSRVTELIDINTFFNSISYNSSNNIISFLNKRGVVVATLDASSFVVDKFVENVTLDSSTNELVITFNTASGKSPIRVPLGSISGQGTVQSVKMNGGTPIQPVNGVIDLGTVITEHQSLANYPTKSEMNIAIQQAGQGETVVINSDGANIVDGHSNSKLTAPSSRLEKELYLNLKALYDNLAGIAFSGTAPQWQTVAAPKYSITAGTLSQVTATYNGTALPATNVNEGEVTIVLTPDSGTALADGDIHITIGGKEVRFTRSGNNVTFVLSGDATVAATAFDGITVNAPAAGSNFTIDKSSVRLNTANETVELTPNEHCSWANPVNVVVTYGVDNITSQCAIVESGGKQVITLPALNDGSKAITVTATAVVNQHITVTFPTNRANMVIKHGNDELTGNSVDVYSDMLDYAITFEPAEGCMWTRVTPQATGGTMTNDGDVYTLVISASDTSDITVTAVTQSIPKYNITLPSTNVTAEILKGGAGSGKVYGGEVIVKLTPDEGYRVSVDSITMGNLSPATLIEGTDYTVADNDGVKTVTIYNVTGNITITATAEDTNYLFKNVGYICFEGQFAFVGAGESVPTFISPLIDLGADRVSDISVKFKSSSGTSSSDSLVIFNAQGEYLSFRQQNQVERTESLGNTCRYIRLYGLWANIADCYIDVMENGNYVRKFSGSDYAGDNPTKQPKAYTYFLDTPFWPGANSNGDYEKSALRNYLYYGNLVNNTCHAIGTYDSRKDSDAVIWMEVGVGATGTHECKNGVGVVVEIPINTNIKFSCGYKPGNNTLTNPYLQLINSSSGSRDFYTLNTSATDGTTFVRESSSGAFDRACLVFDMATYLDPTKYCFIADNNNHVLWIDPYYTGDIHSIIGEETTPSQE